MKNDRWATREEIRESLVCETDATAAGEVLYREYGKNYLQTGEAHRIILGVTGCGKSRRVIMPAVRQIFRAGESLIIVDPKGEIYHETGCYVPPQYQKYIIDFSDIMMSDGWNLLTAPLELYRSGDPAKRRIAMDMLDEISVALFPLSGSEQDFWQQSAKSLFDGVARLLFDYAEAEQVTMANIYRVVAEGDLRQLRSFVEGLMPGSLIATQLHGYLNTADVTRGGIMAVFAAAMSMFCRSELLVDMLAANDLAINRLDGEAPVAIYIILPEGSGYDKLCGVLIGQLLRHYMRLAQEKFAGRLPRRLNVCVEEAYSVGRTIGDLPRLMSSARSRNIRIQLVLQSLAQLDAVWGSGDGCVIRDNADLLISFRTKDWSTLTELSQKCGEREYEVNGRISREPLVSPTYLMSMQTGQALIMDGAAGTQYISWLPDLTELCDCRDWQPPQRRRVSQRRAPLLDVKQLLRSTERKWGKPKKSAGKSKAADTPQPAAPAAKPAAPAAKPAASAAKPAAPAAKPAASAAKPAASAEASADDKPQYRMMVFGVGRDRNIGAVTAGVAAVTSWPIEDARYFMQHLPQELVFTDRELAEVACRILTDAGALVNAYF